MQTHTSGIPEQKRKRLNSIKKNVRDIAHEVGLLTRFRFFKVSSIRSLTITYDGHDRLGISEM